MDNMDNIETGGPAFPAEIGPASDKHIIQTGDGQWLHPGMTLRDYFAAKAMQTLIDKTQVKDFDWCASKSYKMADEMMKARG